jgi:hypothetical protein
LPLTQVTTNQSAWPQIGFNDREFARYQKRIIQQLKRRFNLLRYREEIRHRTVPVTPLMLELKFAEILRLIRPKAKYPQNASYLNRHFNEEERRVIYALLEEIIEQNHWHGIEWYPVYHKIYDKSSNDD